MAYSYNMPLLSYYIYIINTCTVVSNSGSIQYTISDSRMIKILNVTGGRRRRSGKKKKREGVGGGRGGGGGEKTQERPRLQCSHLSLSLSALCCTVAYYPHIHSDSAFFSTGTAGHKAVAKWNEYRGLSCAIH